MSSIPKHFRLKYKEEFYMQKEFEKVRKEVKKDFLQFKERLASKPALDEGPVHGHQPRCPQALGQPSPGEREHVSRAAPGKPAGSPRATGPGSPAGALLPDAPRGARRSPGPGEAAAPAKTRPFCPQEFYLRSSAYHRHRPARRPPVIAPGAGTSRPAVLLPPPAPPLKPRARPDGGGPPAAASRPAPDVARGRDAGAETAVPAEVLQVKRRQSSAKASEDSDAEAAGRRGRGRVRTRFLREVGEQGAAAARPDAPQTHGGSLGPSAALEAGPGLLPARVRPTSIDDVLRSLRSEAQLAADQTFRELVQSLLGQDYDIKMEVGDPQPE